MEKSFDPALVWQELDTMVAEVARVAFARSRSLDAAELMVQGARAAKLAPFSKHSLLELRLKYKVGERSARLYALFNADDCEFFWLDGSSDPIFYAAERE